MRRISYCLPVFILLTVCEVGWAQDTVVPQVSVTSPAQNNELFDDFPVELAGTVSDDVAVASASIRITDRLTGLVWEGLSGTWVSGSTTYNPLVVPGDDTWSYSFDPPGMTTGSYLTTLIALDTSNNLGVSPYPQKGFGVGELDTTPPQVAVTSPAQNNELFDDFPVELAGTVSDNVEVASASIRITDRLTGLVWEGMSGTWVSGSTTYNPVMLSVDGTWSYTFDPPGMATGSYLSTVIARDTSGNLGVSPYPQKGFGVGELDTTPPQVAVTSPAQNNELFDDFPVELAGTVSDNVEVASASIRITDRFTGLVWEGMSGTWVSGSTTYNPVTLSGDGSWSYIFDPPGAATGSYLSTVIARDTSGNLGVSPYPQKGFGVGELDTKPPQVEITSPAQNNELFDNFPVELTGTVSDDVGVASAFIRITDLSTLLVWEGMSGTWVSGSTTFNAVELPGDGTWSYQLTAPTPTEGRFMVTMLARDLSGNQAVSPVPYLTFFVGQQDLEAPEPFVSVPEFNGELFDTFPVTISGSVIELNDISSVSIRLIDTNNDLVWDEQEQQWVNDTTVFNAATTLSGNDWTYEFNPPSPIIGQFQVTVTATDAFGNKGVSVTPQRFFKVGEKDREVPVVAVITPIIDQGATLNFPVTFGGIATDNVSISTVAVKIVDMENGLAWDENEQDWVSGDLAYNLASYDTASLEWAFVFDPPNIQSGVFSVTALAADTSGNMRSSTAPQRIFDAGGVLNTDMTVTVDDPVNGMEFDSFPVALSGSLFGPGNTNSVGVRITDLGTGLSWTELGSDWVVSPAVFNSVDSFNSFSWMYEFDPVVSSSGNFAIRALALTDDEGIALSDDPEIVIKVADHIAAMFDGDSLVYGAGAVRDVSDYPTVLCNGLTPRISFRCINDGVGGDTVEGASAVAQDTIDTFITPVNLLAVWLGTNDLLQSEHSQSVYRDLQSYISARQAAGWKVAVLTLPAVDVTDASEPDSVARNTAVNLEREKLNTLLLSDAAGADFVVDVASLPELSDPSNTTYRDPDKVHITPAGYQVIADLVRPYFQDLLQ